MNQPQISVIIPVYNAEKFLPQCLNSLLNQTYPYWKACCVDDGSKDGSWDILQQYAAKDNRFKIFHQENAGVSAARNRGLDIATGDYITFMDADDYISPVCYERALAVIQAHQPDCVMFDYQEVSEDETSLPVPTDTPVQKISDPFNLFIQRRSSIPANLWSKIYRAEILKNLRFADDLFYVEDLWFNMQALHKMQTIYYLPQKLYAYVRNDTSITKSTFNERKANGFLRLCGKIHQIFGNESYFPQIQQNISNLSLKFMMKNMQALPEPQKFVPQIAKLLHTGAVSYKNLPLKLKIKLWKIGRKYRDAQISD